MPTDLGTLVGRTRRFMRDRPDQDTLNGSISSGVTTLTTGFNPATNRYGVNELIEIDSETMIVRTVSGANATITVTRGAFDTTAASHANSASILVRPAWTFADYVDGLNAAIDASFPLLYKPVIDESLTAVTGTYEYTLPNMPGTYSGDTLPIPYVYKVLVKETGDYVFREAFDWTVIRGSAPKLRFRRDEFGTVRVMGFGPFPPLAAATDTLDALWPKRAERLLTEFAAQWLLASGEAGRSRADTGATDARESANRAGASMSASGALLSRFQAALHQVAMPPMPVPVLASF